jgi:hypothetical protein
MRRTLQRQRRDHADGLALCLAASGSGDIGYNKKWPAGMHPTRRLDQRPRLAGGVIELGVSAIGVGLEDPGIAGQMRLRMLAAAIARVIEHRSPPAAPVRQTDQLVLDEPIADRLGEDELIPFVLGMTRAARSSAADEIEAAIAKDSLEKEDTVNAEKVARLRSRRRAASAAPQPRCGRSDKGTL